MLHVLVRNSSQIGPPFLTLNVSSGEFEGYFRSAVHEGEGADV